METAVATKIKEEEKQKIVDLPQVISKSQSNVLIDPKQFDQVQRIGRMYAASNLVPEHFRGKEADCMIAHQLAERLGVDTFMLMQNLYVVHGKPGFEAKLTIALINSRGPFDGPIQWKWSGTKNQPDWACTAYATHKDTKEVCEARVDWAMVKKEGWLDKKQSKWQTMPEIMFKYRSATFLGRLYCPEVTMGLPTIDEVGDIVDVEATVIDPEQILLEELSESSAKKQAADIQKNDFQGSQKTPDAEPTQQEQTPSEVQDEQRSAIIALLKEYAQQHKTTMIKMIGKWRKEDDSRPLKKTWERYTHDELIQIRNFFLEGF